MSALTTPAIYDAHASGWARRAPVLLSDFTARPIVLEELGSLLGARVLDLGCGEGYVARLVAAEGALSVHGVDVSAEMIAKARQATPIGGSCAMRFDVADVTSIDALPTEQFDRVMAVFLFNYLTRAEMTAVMRVARARLRPGGRFVFTVPHPCFPYMREAAPPFYFDTAGKGYFGGVDTTYEGKIWRRDREAVPVRCVHKTIEDYFSALAEAGFTAMPRVRELRVSKDHVRFDGPFFRPLEEHPLHMLFRVEAPS